MKILKSILVLLSLSLLPAFAYAGGDDTTIVQGGDATELTQLLNNALLKENSQYQSAILDHQGRMLFTQSEMLAKQLLQLNDMVQNTKRVSSPVWSKTNNLLQDLAKVVRQGQALSYASQNVDEKFRTLYPGYRASNDYSKDYRAWSDSSMDSIRGALNSANLQANDFASEDTMIYQLQDLSKTNEGRMQAIQVGNMIAMENVQQMRKLRQLQMAQMQAQNNYLAKNQQEDISKKAAADKFFEIDKTQKEYKSFRGGSRR